MFKKLIVLFSVLLFCAGTIFAQEEEADGTDAIVKVDGTAPADHFVMNYNLGAEYTYAVDLPLYNPIPMYADWKNSLSDISTKLVDNPGINGHFFRIVNQLEWRKDKLSFTAFANLTLNYLPAYFDTSLSFVPACFKGGVDCFKAAVDIWLWGLSGPWLLVNVCTLFTMPIIASGCCLFAGAVCFAAVPLSIVAFSIPMFTIGGSIDYHPYSNNIFDSKLSLGFDIDGYRGILHAGFFGIFAQAEAAAFIKNIRLYTQVGYRIDTVNVISTIKTAQGKVKQGSESKYVPAPYVKVGASWCFGRD